MYGKEASNSACHGPALGNLYPFSLLLSAYNFIKSIATFFTDFFAFSSEKKSFMQTSYEFARPDYLEKVIY